MERKRTISIAVVALLAALAMPVGLAAQQHHHYKLIDMGTYGGPQSYIVSDYEYFGPAQVLNNSGIFVGWADTLTTDAYPGFCFNADCSLAHGFQWQNGFRTELRPLAKGVSSAANWVSANGLIAGASQNGQTNDPINPGFPIVHAVLWKNGHIKDLGTLPEGGYYSAAHSVNGSGQVVGWALNTIFDQYSLAELGTFYDNYEPVYSYQMRAFLWEENGGMKDLGTLGTGLKRAAVA